MEERIIYLPVSNETGEVDYEYVEYDLREAPQQGEHDIIDGWEWKPFRLVRADE